MIECPYCKQEFETLRKCSNHARLCKFRPDYEERLARFKQGCGKSKGKQLVKRIKFTIICESCNKPYTKVLTESEYKNLKHHYCSRSCANRRVLNKETKQKISKTLTKREDQFCKTCNKLLCKGNKSGYCGKCLQQTEEYKNKISNTLKGKTGGYRKGSGYGKSGWYKGYYCDSSWELAFVIYNLEHDIKFERNKKQFLYTYKNKQHNYIPDWKIDNKYVEIKGYWTEQWQAKLDQFPKEEKLTVLTKKEIKPYLDYVIESYGKDFIKLYE